MTLSWTRYVFLDCHLSGAFMVQIDLGGQLSRGGLCARANPT